MQFLCRACVGFLVQTLHSATCGESVRYKENVGFCVGSAEFLFPIDIRIAECSADNKMALVGTCAREVGFLGGIL